MPPSLTMPTGALVVPLNDSSPVPKTFDVDPFTVDASRPGAALNRAPPR
ncbi:MAG: hypothetical protein IPM99_23030 [Rubrivivax sp.]|nr:hypothetical protein [Rubrivivax sp.]